MPGSAAGLYEEDFARWSEEQSAALREAAKLGTNLPLDWENLAEEVESLGRSQRRELRSRIAVIVEHLLKLQCSPAADPRRSWMETVGQQRSEIELVVGDSPSLKGEIGDVVAEEPQRLEWQGTSSAPCAAMAKRPPRLSARSAPPATPRTRCSATGFRATPLSPRTGRGSRPAPGLSRGAF